MLKTGKEIYEICKTSNQMKQRGHRSNENNKDFGKTQTSSTERKSSEVLTDETEIMR